MEVKGVGIGNGEERQGIEGADGVRESGRELREREQWLKFWMGSLNDLRRLGEMACPPTWLICN